MEDYKSRCKELVRRLNEASEAYYNGGEEIMSNYEWDAMFDELLSLEAETGYALPDSPTQNTGYEENNGEREAHEFPALSLAKTKQVSELIKWAEEREVWLSWKLDGLTLVLTYDGGKLTRILTRGNGVTGTNITYLKNSIKGFPLKIKYKGHLVVRGEAVISYSDFALINDTIEDDDEKYANPRNLASGTLSLDDAEKVKERRVRFHAFTLVHLEDNIVSWGERMEFLEKEGFMVVDREKTDAAGIADVVERWTKRVENGEMDLPVDGLVICYDDTDYAASGALPDTMPQRPAMPLNGRMCPPFRSFYMWNGPARRPQYRRWPYLRPSSLREPPYPGRLSAISARWNGWESGKPARWR